MLHFKTEKVTKRVTRIFGFSSELMYLIEGDNKAALLDTGSGFGSLKGCIDSLTSKPLIVLLTHGHVDHAMGADEFQTVYMSRKDHAIFEEHGTIDFRMRSLSMITDDIKISKSDMVPTANRLNFIDLKEGDSFDLGGITIEVFDCFGHTEGSMVMLLKEERSLLLGDACNPFTFMFDYYSTTITEYISSLQKLMNAVKGKYDTVYLSHGNGNGDRGMIEGVLNVCKDILAGNTDDIPFQFQGVKGLVAKAIGENGRRADGGIGNIVYNKNKI